MDRKAPSARCCAEGVMMFAFSELSRGNIAAVERGEECGAAPLAKTIMSSLWSRPRDIAAGEATSWLSECSPQGQRININAACIQVCDYESA